MTFDPKRVDPDTYKHLKAIARRIYNERAAGSATLQPTALLNEAWARVGREGSAYNDRAHFMATAAAAMRHVLVDRARALQREKRGSGWVQTTLSGLSAAEQSPISFLDFDRALTELTEASPVAAEVVLLRSVGGLTVPEVARVMGVGTSTVDRAWRRGRAFLVTRLEAG